MELEILLFYQAPRRHPPAGPRPGLIVQSVVLLECEHWMGHVCHVLTDSVAYLLFNFSKYQ